MSRRGLRAEVEKEKEVATALLTGNAARDLAEVAKRIALPEADASYILKIHLLNAAVAIAGKGRGAIPPPLFQLLMDSIKIVLVDTHIEVRSAALRLIRYLCVDATTVSEIYHRRLDVFFVISLEVENKKDLERRQAMQIIRQCIQIDPSSVTDTIASSLVAIATHVDDTFKEVALETLCELAVSNAKLAAAHGGIDVIVRAVLDCDSRVKVEALVLVLLTISADPRSRHYLQLETVLPRLLAPFTDRNYCHTTKTATQDGRNTSIEGQQLLSASSYAVVCVLQTWPGVLSLCATELGVASLVQILTIDQKDFNVHNSLLALIFGIFDLVLPPWCGDFATVLESSFSLDMLAPAGLSQSEQRARANSAAEAGFVFVPKDNPAATAAAAAAALNGAPPPHAEGSYRRPNLARNHVAVLLAAFCDAGLFDALVKLSASLIDQRLCVRATVLLEGLYNLAGKVLPIHKVTALAVLPRLLEITTAHQNTSEERLRAKLAIDYLKAVRDKRTHAEASISRKVSTVTEVVPLQQHLPRWANNSLLNDSTFLTLLKTSRLLDVKEHIQWDWTLLNELFENTASFTKKRLELKECKKAIKQLLTFFKPSSRFLGTTSNTSGLAGTLESLGKALFKNLLGTEEGLALIKSSDIVPEIVSLLSDLAPNAAGSTMSQQSLKRTLSRSYLVFLGIIVSAPRAQPLLENPREKSRVYKLCQVTDREDILELLLPHLEFLRQGGLGQNMMSQLALSQSPRVRLMVCQYLDRVARWSWKVRQTPFVQKVWVGQLNDANEDVSSAALEALSVACDDVETLKRVVQIVPPVVQLGDPGIQLYGRLVSVPAGFKLAKSQGDFIAEEISRWRNAGYKAYVHRVEACIEAAMQLYLPAETRDSDPECRLVASEPTREDGRSRGPAYLPMHFYSELCKCGEGAKMLLDAGVIEDLTSRLKHLASVGRMYPRAGQSVSFWGEEQTAVKATLWAIGHIGSCPAGYALLPSDTCSRVAGLAASGPNLLLRGTCIYVLGLLGSTQTGAQTLNDLGWDVRKTADTGVGEQICVAVPSNASEVFYMSPRKLARKTSQAGGRRMSNAPSASKLKGVKTSSPPTKLWGIAEGESVNSTIEAAVEPLLADTYSNFGSSNASSSNNSGVNSGSASRGEPAMFGGAGGGGSTNSPLTNAASATAAAVTQVALAAAVLSGGSNSPGGSRRAGRPPRPSHPDSPAARKKARKSAEVCDAVLQCVACMSNEIVLSNARSLLAQLRMRHKDIVETTRVYLKVRELLDSASFGLDTRRLLHNLFTDISFLAKGWNLNFPQSSANFSSAASASSSTTFTSQPPAPPTINIANVVAQASMQGDSSKGACIAAVAAVATDAEAKQSDSGAGGADEAEDDGELTDYDDVDESLDTEPTTQPQPQPQLQPQTQTQTPIQIPSQLRDAVRSQVPPPWAALGDTLLIYTQELAADEAEAWKRVQAEQQTDV